MIDETDPLFRAAEESAETTPRPRPSQAPGRLPATARLGTVVILRKEDGSSERLRRDADGVTPGADAAVARASSSSSGAPLPGDVRARFESSLGADLSAVRVHTGATSAAAASAVGAKAYTVGNDIHFAADRYAPADPFGLHLLAHEVAHTQQQAGAAPARQHKLEVSAPGDAAEVEADRAADAMVAGTRVALTAAPAAVARDMDQTMQQYAQVGVDDQSNDGGVEIIYGHSTVGDEGEAKAILAQIRGAQPGLMHVIAQNGDYAHTLADNAAAAFKVEQYLATVSDSGNFLGEFQASYFQSKKDYGEFLGTWTGFSAAGGKLGGAGSLSSGLASLKNNPAFAQMFQKFEQTRDKLQDDSNTLQQNQDSANGKQMELQATMMATRSAVASNLAKDKEGKLAGIVAQIDSAVDTIMTVGQIAMTCVSGVMAMGSSGFDVSKLVEDNPTGYTPPPPKTPAAAAPDTHSGPSQHVANPPGMRNPDGNGASINGPGSPPPAATGPTGPNGTGTSINKPSSGPADYRSYSGPPKSDQAVAAAKSAASAGISLAGGPKSVLKAAITALEQSQIDVLSAEIGAAKVEADLSGAAATASHAASVKQAYITAMNTMIQNVDTMLTDKENLENETNQLVGMAKQTNPNVAAALRLVTAGDKFLSQVDLSIRLGQESSAKADEAAKQRYDINGGNPGDLNAPIELKYYSTSHIPASESYKFFHPSCTDGNIYTLHENNVELKHTGRDGLQSGITGGTAPDVKSAVAELQQQKVDVQAKRDQAQAALGMDAPVGQAHTN